MHSPMRRAWGQEIGVCQLGHDHSAGNATTVSTRQQQGHAELYRISVGIARPADRGSPLPVAEPDIACDVCLAVSGH